MGEYTSRRNTERTLKRAEADLLKKNSRIVEMGIQNTIMFNQLEASKKELKSKDDALASLSLEKQRVERRWADVLKSYRARFEWMGI